jgi:hypothetical protein
LQILDLSSNQLSGIMPKMPLPTWRNCKWLTKP